jgi:hypothetical protein
MKLRVPIQEHQQPIVQRLELLFVDGCEVTSFPFDLSKPVTEPITLGQARISIHGRRRLSLNDLSVEVTFLMQQVQVDALVQSPSPAQVAERESEFALNRRCDWIAVA